jgi:hypothetical protein
MSQSIWNLGGILLQMYFGTVSLRSSNYLSCFGCIICVGGFVHEMNRYAMERKNEGNTRGGTQWEKFTVSEFKAYVVIWLYMGMRRQPNIKSYWMKVGSIFHCPNVSNVMI